MKNLKQSEIKKQQSFEKEIVPHLDALYNFALQLSSNPNDAKDLVQNTVVKAYRFYDTFEKGTNAKAWLFRILNNSYINKYRKETRQPDLVNFKEVSSFFESIRAERTDTSNLEHRIYRELVNDNISEAVNNLREKYRTVVLLCDLEDFTYEEISNMLDIPIGTVRSRLHRGRLELKKQLSSYARNKGY